MPFAYPAARAALAAALAATAAVSAVAEAAEERTSDILDELERVLGSGRRSAVEARVEELEDVMRPTFVSLPQSGDGRLPSSGVRYLLHRFFVERHGWFVNGLKTRGESWNSTSPSVFFAEHADAATEGVFERRLGSHGLSLHETAVFAAALENLVHEETVERLHAAYTLAGLGAMEGGASEAALEQVIDTYMLMLLKKLSPSMLPAEVLAEERAYASNPEWNRTLEHAHAVRREVQRNAGSPASFATALRILETIADRHSGWNALECSALKRDLALHERNGTGRVLLKDFYGAALSASNYYTTETKEYLRKVGALDETTFSQPSVIIPNYVYSPSNCLANLKFYSVCCINECEALLSPLERHFAAPDALPGDIVAVVEQLRSPTVDAPRRLSVALVRRLGEIAEQHRGRVPLHGRLFSLWMHHAFPLECPFPHLSGEVELMTAEEFETHYSARHALNPSELQAAVEQYADIQEGDGECELPWSSQEELLAYPPPPRPPPWPAASPTLPPAAGGAARVGGHGGFVRAVIRYATMAAAVVAMSAVTLRMRRACPGPSRWRL